MLIHRLFCLQTQHDQQQQKYQNQQQPADDGMINSYSSIVNHNYSQHQPLSSSSSLPSHSDSSVSVTASSPTPQILSTVVAIDEEQHVPAEPIQSISYGNGCGVSMHRNKSSCSLEVGDQMLRQSLERSSPSLMSVSDVGPGMVGSLKTATASN